MTKTWEDEAKKYVGTMQPAIRDKYLADFDVIVLMSFFAEKMVNEQLEEVRGLLRRTKDVIYNHLCPVNQTQEQKDVALREIWRELEMHWLDIPTHSAQSEAPCRCGWTCRCHRNTNGESVLCICSNRYAPMPAKTLLPLPIYGKPHRCSSDRPHAAHTFGGRPMEYCEGVKA